MGLSRDGDEEPEESWENLAGLEIGERGAEVEDACEKSGGRKEGAAVLEAARELLLKLKKSPLAHKLRVNALKLFKMVNIV